MAVNNISPNSNSFNVFSSMGYTTSNYQNPVVPGTSKMNAQNLILKINEPEVKLNINIPHIDADLYDKTPQDPLDFKDMKSLGMRINNGVLSLSANDLTSTVKTLIAKETDMIKDFNINFTPGERVQADIKVKKFLTFNVKIEGKVSAQPTNNMVRLTPDKISLGKIPVKGLLDFFGLEIGEIVKIGKPNGSFFTSGDSIYFGPTQLVTNPTLDAHVTDVRTGMGSLSIMLGDSAKYQPKVLHGADNYLRLRGGNVNFNGFNLQDADVSLLDGTPNDPFDIDNDPSKKVISSGRVAIPEEFIATALKNKAGDGSSLKNMKFTMPNGVGKLKASMWGFLPISLDLNFSRSTDGKQLKVTPDKGKLLGFIPLPDSMLRSTLAKETEGQPDGNGVTVNLDKLADLQTPNGLRKVETDKGTLILYM